MLLKVTVQKRWRQKIFIVDQNQCTLLRVSFAWELVNTKVSKYEIIIFFEIILHDSAYIFLYFSNDLFYFR